MNAIHKNLFESVHCVQDTKETAVTAKREICREPCDEINIDAVHSCAWIVGLSRLGAACEG